MNSSQRLFVTPEERARRMAQQNGHPHGGEGACGGKEGHGTPEIMRNGANGRGAGIPGAEVVRKETASPRAASRSDVSSSRAKAKLSAERVTVNSSDKNTVTHTQLVSAMKMSFLLGEPVCRKYGMPYSYGKKEF